MRDKQRMRRVLRMVKANDRARVSTDRVAASLAALNYEVHLGVRDRSVGPRCIVAWRHRPNGAHKGGGGHQFYTGTVRDGDTPALPTIASGMDVNALIEAMAPISEKMFEAMREGKPGDGFEDEINAALAGLPDEPDENLR